MTVLHRVHDQCDHITVLSAGLGHYAVKMLRFTNQTGLTSSLDSFDHICTSAWSRRSRFYTPSPTLIPGSCVKALFRPAWWLGRLVGSGGWNGKV